MLILNSLKFHCFSGMQTSLFPRLRLIYFDVAGRVRITIMHFVFYRGASVKLSYIYLYVRDFDRRLNPSVWHSTTVKYPSRISDCRRKTS
jgi:hypothetical protein